MAAAKYYSPRVDRDLIRPLYCTAKSRRIPMTRLASTLIREGFDRLIGDGDEQSAIVREEPPALDPRERQP